MAAKQKEKQQQQKDVVTRLADVGEAAMHRLSDVPGSERFLGAANAFRDRLDDLSKRVRGLEGLEQRLAELERRVDELQGTSRSKPRTGTKRRTTAKKTTAATSTSAPAAHRDGGTTEAG
jgi:TolA-binding protein